MHFWYSKCNSRKKIFFVWFKAARVRINMHIILTTIVYSFNKWFVVSNSEGYKIGSVPKLHATKPS